MKAACVKWKCTIFIFARMSMLLVIEFFFLLFHVVIHYSYRVSTFFSSHEVNFKNIILKSFREDAFWLKESFTFSKYDLFIYFFVCSFSCFLHSDFLLTVLIISAEVHWKTGLLPGEYCIQNFYPLVHCLLWAFHDVSQVMLFSSEAV